MSEESRFRAWQAGCRDSSVYGATASDTFYLGYRNYVQPFPCPNGLPIIDTLPQENAIHRERVAKAKQFIDDFSREFRIREAAGFIKPKQVEEDIKEIKTWLSSLFNPLSQTGSHASKPVVGT